MMVEASCLMEQPGHAHVLDATYVHMHNSLHFYLKFRFFWVGRGRKSSLSGLTLKSNLRAFWKRKLYYMQMFILSQLQ